jgi:RNA-binding protein NOB1
MKIVVVDAGALIHKQRLDELDCKLYTTSGILKEVRDPASRQHVQLMPAKISEKVPTVEDIKIVRDFATKSGDIGFLSANDIGILALASCLAREHSISLRAVPVTRTDQATAADRAEAYTWTPEKTEDEDGEGGWVTCDNFAELSAAESGCNASVPETVAEQSVSVMTGDYSIQNVCLQMGLGVLSYDNLCITTIKQWGLMCVACWNLTRDTTKAFCPSCGNDTVRRVSINTSASGEVTLTGCRPRRPQLKGTIFSIPKPRGGRQAAKPVFAEDEMMIGGRDRDMRRRAKMFERELEERLAFGADDAFASGYLPMGNFGAAPKVIAGYGRRNPNANNFKRPNSKK